MLLYWVSLLFSSNSIRSTCVIRNHMTHTAKLWSTREKTRELLTEDYLGYCIFPWK